MSIKSKLLANTILASTILFCLILSGWFSLRNLARLHGAGAQLAQSAGATAHAGRAVLSQYRAVADAVVLRDLAKTDQEWAREKEATGKRLEEMANNMATPEEKQQLASARGAFERMVSLYEGRLRPMLAATPEVTAEMRETMGQIGKEAALLHADTLRLAEKSAVAAKKSDLDLDAALKRRMAWLLAAGAVALLLQIAAGVLASAGILKPLNELNGLVRELAEGGADLSKKLESGRDDELGHLARNLNRFMDHLHDMVQCVAKDCIRIVICSNKVEVMSAKTGKEAQQLSLQSISVSTASEEMSATAADIARSCLRAAEGGRVATEVASQGSEIVNETVAGMNRIAERVRSAAVTVASLGKRSDQIGQIVGTIEDIADQTNLLALNAAIEAARAGEQGRGFAVVADEVRALAERTTRATSEISSMIRSIQHETASAVESMEQGVSEVKRGSEDAARSGEALGGIIDQIDAVNMQVSQIATAAEEQTATTMEISASIQQINDIAQHSLSHIDETTLASNSMLSMSESLMGVLGKFTLREDIPMVLNKAKCAHIIFICKIKSHLLGDKKIDASALPTHLTCGFGQWYQNKGKHSCGHSSRFQAIDAPHAEVHELGKQVILACDRGDRGLAAQYAERMTARSGELIGILEELERECGA